MSAYSTPAANHGHVADLAHPIALISETLRAWRQRSRTRHELAHMTERDFHDVGASWSDFAHEANKPFWQA